MIVKVEWVEILSIDRERWDCEVVRVRVVLSKNRSQNERINVSENVKLR
jgi:hypothetical protein